MSKKEVTIILEADFPNDWIEKFLRARLQHDKVFIHKVIINNSVTKERSSKYPFRNMKVGDSYIYPKVYTRENQIFAANAAGSFARNSKDCQHYKFTTKKDGNQIIITRIK